MGIEERQALLHSLTLFKMRLDKYDLCKNISWNMDLNDKRKAITGHRPTACEILSKYYENMKVVGGMICVQEEQQRIQEKLVLWKKCLSLDLFKLWFQEIILLLWTYKDYLTYACPKMNSDISLPRHYIISLMLLALDYTTTIHNSIRYKLSIHILLLVNDRRMQLSAHNHQQVKWCCVLTLYLNGK